MSNKILVLGSTGKTGKRVYEKLKLKNCNVAGASRSGHIPFDWCNSNTWPAALQNIDTVYITFQPDLAVPHSIEIITAFASAAQQAGVQKLVLLSGRGETEAMACEHAIMRSGLNYTIIRCSFFMQNFSEGFWVDGIISGEFVIPFVTTAEPFVDTNDIADVVVEAITDPHHNGKIYELTGPELLTFKDAVECISKGLTTKVSLVELSMTDYVSTLRQQQMPEDYVWLIQYLFTEVLDGRNASVTTDIEMLLGRKATSFKQFVENSIETSLWNLK